ncbi:uncharacterized protein K489DRAFT_366604 [Dissoconium aciculare CBS 342.82]|uniref:TFIIS N-terminal domain-containing protein n=1 Tax=Dissoconium aciculare CBS 342.82 TaxID=1314786 RepID=A0A6J3MHP2_9PEZI|nr:uncharacterized protein K489DRAFT_366604 [Dissoconium aciculare CBS 342.82]KAF1827455.1 hypothetical protein K489DRAFT_366604 [Dissoconium aciculare CBS 342.82]
MEDLEDPQGAPVTGAVNEPEGNKDPRDPLRPGIDEEDNARTPPLADPTADMEGREDNGELGMGDETDGQAAADDDDELESDLEELDEAEFENFDASAVNISAQPMQVDESNVALLGVHKRKRTAEEEAERERKKKKKERRREKPKRSKKAAGDDDDLDQGEDLDGKRARRSKLGPDGRPVKAVRRPRTPENEENLTPEERRRRALDRKMEDALKTNRVSRRKQAVVLEERADQEIEAMRQRMAKACEMDAQARAQGEVAVYKLKILPDVVELMNRNTIQAQLVDPDVNILEAVRFMLEPADQDAALPNYQIQRELFAILTKLNIGKEALKSSGIGKVVLFYTRSVQPQPEIKRQAERLVGEWMRVILGKSKDRRNISVETRTYDPSVQIQRATAPSQAEQVAAAAERRRRVLEPSRPANRARLDNAGVGTYTIAPVSNLSNVQGIGARRPGAAGEEAFRRIAARSAMKANGTGRR